MTLKLGHYFSLMVPFMAFCHLWWGKKGLQSVVNESLTWLVPVWISSIVFYYLLYILWCSIWPMICYSSLLNLPCSFLSLNINCSHIGSVFPCPYLLPEFLNWMHYCQWGSYLELFLVLITWLWALLTYNEEFRDAKCLAMHGNILPNEEVSQIPNGKNLNANNNDTEIQCLSNSIKSILCSHD